LLGCSVAVEEGCSRVALGTAATSTVSVISDAGWVAATSVTSGVGEMTM